MSLAQVSPCVNGFKRSLYTAHAGLVLLRFAVFKFFLNIFTYYLIRNHETNYDFSFTRFAKNLNFSYVYLPLLLSLFKNNPKTCTDNAIEANIIYCTYNLRENNTDMRVTRYIPKHLISSPC